MIDLAEKHAQGVTVCDECDEVRACRCPYTWPVDNLCVCMECWTPQEGCSWDDFPLAPAEPVGPQMRKTRCPECGAFDCDGEGIGHCAPCER